VKWSVSIVAEGDREVSHDEVVALADAVAGWGGIATGLGSLHYGAQVVVEADDRASAVQRATEVFTLAVARAGLPQWPVTSVDALSEDDDLE
jgi:hypothetical protein